MPAVYTGYRSPMLLLVTSAAAVDHAAWQAVLDTRVVYGKVDYAGLKKDPAALDRYLATLRDTPVASLGAAEKKALWINAYNACTVDLIVDRWPLRSIKDVSKPWGTPVCALGGETLTLDQIEHERLRPLGDPRIHAAINCASIGCPPLAPKAFTADGLDAQLDAASRVFAATAKLDGETLVVSRIHDWFGDDFVARYGTPDLPGLSGKEEAAANFVAAFNPTLAPRIRQGGLRVRYGDYDWAINAW